MNHELTIIGCGIAAPGLDDMAALRACFSNATGTNEPGPAAATSLLSARERRRAPETVRLSMAASEQACIAAGLTPGEPVAVFCSGMGDLAINDYMCRTLAEEPDMLSPMRFHNSVHNAAAGYWSIGAGATGDVTALSAASDSLVGGLIETAARVHCSGQPVLLVVYDAIAEGPLRAVWPSRQPFAGALVLGPANRRGRNVRLRLQTGLTGDRCPPLPGTLNERIEDNPAARTLHALALGAGLTDGPVRLAAAQGPGLCLEPLA